MNREFTSPGLFRYAAWFAAMVLLSAVLPAYGQAGGDGSVAELVAIDAPSATLAKRAAAASFAAALEVEDSANSLNAQQRTLHRDEEAQRNTDCETGVQRGKPCKVSWGRVLSESLIFLAVQHTGNIVMDKDTRTQLTTGDFWGKYVYCVEHYRWWRYKDDDPFGVDYIGHPMMGAVTSAIYEQNDPKQRALTFENSKRYWHGRLRAMAYSAAYSAQWKVGPASEASIGNTGIGYYVRARDGVWTNETGMQDFFFTPIGGMAWNVGEDIIDRYITSHVRHAHPNNKMIQIVASFMTPTRAAANITRFRALYYRDVDTRTMVGATR